MRGLLRTASPWLSSLVVHATLLVALSLLLIGVNQSRLGIQLDAIWSNTIAEGDDCSAAAIMLPDVDLDYRTVPVEMDLSYLPEPFRLSVVCEAIAAEETFTSSSRARILPVGTLRGSGRTVEFYGTVVQAEQIVFVLDISGSMGEQQRLPGKATRFQQAAAELVTAIDRLYNNQRFFVVLFNDLAWPMFNQDVHEVALIPSTNENKNQLAKWLESIQPHGWTDPRASLHLALSLDPDAIFLLSDGEFKNSSNRPIGASTLNLLRKINKDKIPIHTIAFQDTRNRRTLQAVAQESGGVYRFVK